MSLDAYNKSNSLVYSSDSRSTEVKEILSENPGFLVKYGIQIFSLIFFALLVILWFIQVPKMAPATILKRDRDSIQNNYIPNEKNFFLEITLSSQYSNDIEVGEKIMIKFSGDADLKNRNITTVVKAISFTPSSDSFLIRTTNLAGNFTNKEIQMIYQNKFQKIEMSYNVRLLQHLYKDIFPKFSLIKSKLLALNSVSNNPPVNNAGNTKIHKAICRRANVKQKIGCNFSYL